MEGGARRSTGMEEEEEKKTEAFLIWAVEMGISDSVLPSPPHSSTPSSCLGHSLLLSQFPDAGGRGLAAAREIWRGEMVLRVPRAALLTRESVLRDEKLGAFFSRHTHLTPTQLLTICLLTEVGKGKGSWWYPYLVQLPRSYDMLATFSQFEIQAFQIDDAIWVSERAVSKTQLEWKQAINLMQEIELKSQLQTFKSWLWASATVCSRTLHVPWDPAGCLCPVGDFFNYAAPESESCSEGEETEVSDLEESPFCKYNDSDKRYEQPDGFSWRLTDGGYEENFNSYCFYARKRYRKGEQVLLSYGTYTNLELLEHYGFLLNENPNDKAFIQLDTAMRTSSSWPKDSLYIQHDGRPSFALVSALRLWATPRNLRKAVGHLAYSGSLLSVENEISVMRFVAKSCQDTLNELPTSIEGDGILLDIIEKMLKNSSKVDFGSLLSSQGELREFFQFNFFPKAEVAVSSLTTKAKRSLERWRLAVQWRLIYKKVLLKCISYCNEVIDSLSSRHVSNQRTSDL